MIRNAAPIRPERGFVLYWIIAARRTRFNFALEHAIASAVRLGKHLLVLEALRCDYRYASDRLHSFVLDGMSDNATRFAAAQIAYFAYVEPRAGAGKGLLSALAKDACLVVTDDYPSSFLQRMVASAARQLDVRLESVDGNGLLPLLDAPQVFPTAYAFRRHLQKRLPGHLDAFPQADPLNTGDLTRGGAIPEAILARWPSALERRDRLPIDHTVVPVPGVRGGEVAGTQVLHDFVEGKLLRYDEDRNEPEKEATSGLSPYLHFGHVSIHHVFAAIASGEAWSAGDLAATSAGKRAGWWGMSPSAEAFLDQAVTWRELGFNFSSRRDDADRFESLPEWAKATLVRHAADPRPTVYGLEALNAGATHDPLWNAAQTQLLREGRIHNYLRMLWGKKILEWTRSPEDAAEFMIELNDRYALDGRDPNSYSGIFWVLGRYDRPWGPERPIFGTIRYMTSANTARKMNVKGYIRKYSPVRVSN